MVVVLFIYCEVVICILGFMDEPAILRKKKPIPLVTTNTTKMFDEEIVVPDDYMLLGSQEKFTPNVPYKDYLTKNRTRVLGTTYVVSYAVFMKMRLCIKMDF